jgi:PAS domain S-box-containing protein
VDYRFLEINPAFESLTGLKGEDIVGKTVLEALPETEPIWIQTYGEVALTGHPVRFESYSGALQKHFEVIAFCPRQNQFAVIFTDVTERKKAEIALQRFELLSNNSRDIILFMRAEDGRLLEANTAALNTYGYTRDELLQMTIFDLRAPGTNALVPQQMARADSKGILFETVHRRKDGSQFPVEVSSQGATINGERTLISIARDITERQQAREALFESEQRLRFHLEHSAMGVVEWDENFYVTRWAGEAERIFGYTEAEMLGRHILEMNIIFGPDTSIVEAVIDRLSSGTSRNIVSSNRNLTKDGRVILCEWYNTILTDSAGKMVSVMSLVLDITGRAQA